MSHTLMQALTQSQNARPNLEKAIYEHFSQFSDEQGNIDYEVDLTVGTTMMSELDGQQYQYVRATSVGVVDAPRYEAVAGWDEGKEETTPYTQCSATVLEFVAGKILHQL